ncbi:hypothetical protein [Streptomyces sp. NPDC050504]|uniref:hypothetical protein n=1 Tax=Streptomyces sp. NPDC050504 TaxID=3365618 RepID=UPI00379B4CB8
MESTTPPGAGPTADPVERLRAMVGELLHSADLTCGVEDLEPHLEAALALLRDHPALRPRFEAELVALLDGLREGVVELVSFTMYELRWPGVREAIESRAADPRRNVSDLRLYEAMLDACADSWRDRDLYARFDPDRPGEQAAVPRRERATDAAAGGFSTAAAPDGG